MKIAIKLSHCVIKPIKTVTLCYKTVISQGKFAIFIAIFYLTRCKKSYIIKGKSVKIAIKRISWFSKRPGTKKYKIS